MMPSINAAVLKTKLVIFWVKVLCSFFDSIWLFEDGMPVGVQTRQRDTPGHDAPYHKAYVLYQKRHL